MTQWHNGVDRSVEAAVGAESRLMAILSAASREIDHSECLDAEDRAEVYAIIKAISSDTQAHRRAVELLYRRLSEGGDA
ncbi:MAG: hypothetical protein J7M21_06455 [Planctomycetes bacterium]|nr:hypothetical protein [Planctomycetota bacterium]